MPNNKYNKWHDPRYCISGRSRDVDGFQAWLTLACIFVTNANTLGSLKVYGLIFEEIVAQKYYNREDASWPISTASTVQNLAGLLTPLLAMRISWRCIEIIQTLLFVLANVGAYFSRGFAWDILCLGIVQGVALSIRYNMNVVINNEYFEKYRATAMGVSLAGSTCGVFVLKPILAYVLDNSDHHFRNAYLTLGIIMSFNLILNLLIRKPRQPCCKGYNREKDPTIYYGGFTGLICNLLKKPSLHWIWVMQTIYFYISRTYTIFIVDYGVDSGFTRNDSRSMLDFWVFGEIGGRLLLGGIVDSRFISLRWNLVIVNLLLSISGFALVLEPTIFSYGKYMGNYYFWCFGMAVACIAALSSLVNMMIVPFGQEYLGRGKVPWAFALGSVVTSFFLLLRPSLIGLSRDYHKSYDLLIIVMASGPLIYSILFAITEPLLKRRRPV